MAKKYELSLRFPLAGVDRSGAYRQHPPFATPAALNVRPMEGIEGRARGGSRPGLGKAYFEDLGGPVNMLAEVATVSHSGLSEWSDGFSSGYSGAWSAASWLEGLPGLTPLGGVATLPDVGSVGAVLQPMTVDTSKPYAVTLDLVAHNSHHWGEYRIFLRMNDATPNVTQDGVEVVLRLGDGEYDGELIVYSSGSTSTYDFTGGDLGYDASGPFQVIVTGDNIKAYWMGRELIDKMVSAPAGARMGFGLHCTEDGGVCLVDTFFLRYFLSSSIIPEGLANHVIAAADGKLYADGSMGAMVEVAGSDVNAHVNLMAADHNQLLYIADHGDASVIEEAGDIDATGLELSSLNIADWTALDIDTDRDVVWLSGCVGSANDGVYGIASVETTHLVLADSAGGAGTGTARVMRGPKVYNPATGSLALWEASVGSVPPGCPLICRYRDRLVLAGAPYSPHVWYMSRQNDPSDWDYTQEDAQTAVAGNNTEAGSTGEPITALIPWKDDYLIFGCLNSMWMLRGDPAHGGMIDNISHSVGVVSGNAWCRGPNGELIWLDRYGIYIMPPDASAVPADVSRHVLPKDLYGINPDLFTINLEYDTEFYGVHIYLTSKLGGHSQHWWFSWGHKGFWPVGLVDGHQPTVVRRNRDGVVLMGCKDGYIREYRKANYNDDGTNFTSYVVYGPIALGRGDLHDGLLSELVGMLAYGSGPVAWRLTLGETHEEAVRGQVFASGSWGVANGLRQLTARPRGRGASFCLTILNANNTPWSVDSISGVIKQVGKVRKR
jgi:hypothetical protein